jgi:hypothetical protein
MHANKAASEEKLARYIHSYALNVYHKKKSFDRLGSVFSVTSMDADVSDERELGIAINNLARLRKLPEMKIVDLKARAVPVIFGTGDEVRLILETDSGDKYELKASMLSSRYLEDFKWGLLPFAGFQTREPISEGPVGGRQTPSDTKVHIITSRGTIVFSPSSQETVFKTPNGRSSCRYEAAGPAFRISYGTGPWSVISDYAQIPMVFQKAMEEAAVSGKLPAVFYRGFVDALSGVLVSGRAGYPPVMQHPAATGSPPSQSFSGDAARRQTLMDAFRKFGIEFDESELQLAEEYLASLSRKR